MSISILLHFELFRPIHLVTRKLKVLHSRILRKSFNPTVKIAVIFARRIVRAQNDTISNNPNLHVYMAAVQRCIIIKKLNARIAR